MDVLFEVVTPLGYTIRTTKEYWQYLVEKKHPCMMNKEDIVTRALQYPDEIRKSRLDPSIYLYYCRADRLYCVVAKHQESNEGFLVTGYPADKVKEGDVIWTK